MKLKKNIGKYLDNKDPFESKYPLLINGRKKVGRYYKIKKSKGIHCIFTNNSRCV